MKKILITTLSVFVICLILTPVIVNAQNIITLQPDSTDGVDAHLSSYSPDHCYSQFASLCAIAGTVSGNPVASRGLIKFDLSSVPSGTAIDSAILSLYFDPTSTQGTHNTYSGSNASMLYRVTESWKEHTVTWNSQPAYTSWMGVELPASTSDDQDYPNIDITQMIQYLIYNPDSNFGISLQLKYELGTRKLIFASSDNADSTIHPKLTIYYSPSAIHQESNDEDLLSIYPNPFNSYLNFMSTQKGTIEIFDIHGKEVYLYQYSSTGEKLRFTPHKAGIYMLRFTTKDQTITKKLLFNP